MPGLTPLKIAKDLEFIVDAQRIYSIGSKADSDELYHSLELAATYLRAIAAGEYKRVVHARWKEAEPGHDILFECSNCGRIISTSWGSCEDEDTHGNNGCDPTEEWLTCPTCGARMDKEAISDDA